MTVDDLLDQAKHRDGFRLLPSAELGEALASSNRRNLFIGGFADPQTGTLTLYRGDFDRLTVPISMFKPLGSGPAPNPSALSFVDCGQTVCLGDYQAAADAILYDVDPEFRKMVQNGANKSLSRARLGKVG